MSFTAMQAATGIAGIGFVYVLSRLIRSSRSSSLPLPPGPPKKFLIGNLLDMPPQYSWLKYHDWAKEFDSDIIHVDAAGTNIILLDSEEAAIELLDKRSAIYSSRPHMPMVVDIMGWVFNFALLPADGFWRATRKLFVHEFSPAALPNYYPNQLRGTHALLRNLQADPEKYWQHLRFWAGTWIMTIAYGIEPKNDDTDPYLKHAERTMETLVTATVPGAFMIDMLPWLKWVPEWMMKDGGFKKQGRIWREMAEEMVHAPFNEAKRAYQSGSYMSNIASRSLENMDKNGDLKEQERVIEASCMSMYVAASDTTVSSVGTFLLAMRGNPKIQARAQAELEAAYGAGHLPDFADFENDFDDFSDKANLPYISALLKEVLRFAPVTPFSVPHLLSKDDTYKGYHLPAGSTVIPNAWAILRKEETYGERTDEFRPERFLLPNGKLNPNMRNPMTAAFGFGRRICPGRHTAVSSIWIAMTSILTSFDVTMVPGDVVDPDAKTHTGGIISYPLPFKADFTVRSEEVAAAIRATEHNSY